MASIYTFKDGKLMYKNKIAYANGDFVSLKDYEALENKVQKLKCELDKTYNQLMEVEKESQERIAELESELEAKVNFETDRLVKLPFDALETANMLINAEYSRQTSSVEKAFTGCNVAKGHIYSVDDLEQIAEHLLVYCKHHREDEE